MGMIFGCDIGFEGDSSITSSSKFEDMSYIFDSPKPINTIFNCSFISGAKMDIKETGSNIGTGLLRLVLNETGDPSVGMEPGEIGVYCIVLHITQDFMKLGKMLKARLQNQTIPADVFVQYKTSKSINGVTHHLDFEVSDMVVDEENFEPENY